jgi:hypothetical protein
MASSTTAQNIIDGAEEILQDTANDRWEEAELLQAVNNGTKEICIVKPDAYITNDSVVLVAGVVQSVPSSATGLTEISRNMGVSPGETPGKAIRLIDRDIMDALNPNWASATASAVVEYYMYDKRNPLKFFVSPPQPSSGFGYVQMAYPATPAEIAIDAAILISDIYRGVLLDYVLYRAYLKDSDVAQNAQRALAHYQAFQNALGVKKKAETEEDPNVN